MMMLVYRQNDEIALSLSDCSGDAGSDSDQITSSDPCRALHLEEGSCRRCARTRRARRGFASSMRFRFWRLSSSYSKMKSPSRCCRASAPMEGLPGNDCHGVEGAVRKQQGGDAWPASRYAVGLDSVIVVFCWGAKGRDQGLFRLRFG